MTSLCFVDRIFGAELHQQHSSCLVGFARVAILCVFGVGNGSGDYRCHFCDVEIEGILENMCFSGKSDWICDLDNPIHIVMDVHFQKKRSDFFQKIFVEKLSSKLKWICNCSYSTFHDLCHFLERLVVISNCTVCNMIRSTISALKSQEKTMWRERIKD